MPFQSNRGRMEKPVDDISIVEFAYIPEMLDLKDKVKMKDS